MGLAIPIALIVSFAVLRVFGLSINQLTLLEWVLATGLMVATMLSLGVGPPVDVLVTILEKVFALARMHRRSKPRREPEQQPLELEQPQHRLDGDGRQEQ